MIPFVKRLLYVALVIAMAASGRVMAQEASVSDSPRIALVIGNGAYRASPLPTAANDAGLMAQTLAAAGFDVTAARDLDGAALRRTIRDFLDKASGGGPRGIAMVYLAGHALQADGDNYFAPVDADLDKPSGVPIETFRIADLTRALAATNLGAKVVVIDGAHADPRRLAPLANGLALVDAEPGTLLAFNAAPGTVAPVDAGPYGVYARTLAQTMKQGGVPVDELFDRLRVAVNSATGGAVVPWDASKLLEDFTFFDRAPNAPALGSAQVPFTSLRSRPLKDFSPEQAYDVALARDTLAAYQDYLAAFPDHPLSRRIRAILAVRREAAFWRDAAKANTPAAYWTYLRRYPNGPHGAEAQRRLASRKEPPANFVPLAFDVPPPPEDEIVIFDERGFVLQADLPPPPPPPLFLLPPLPAPDEALREPPPPPAGPRLLPIPLAVAIPFVRPIIAPGTIAPPRGIGGDYRQPRPFSAGPANGGLVPRPGDARPGAPNVSAPASAVPVPEPVAPRPPQQPKPPAMPRISEPTPPTAPVAKAPDGDAHGAPKPPASITAAPATRPAPPPAPAPLAASQAPDGAGKPAEPHKGQGIAAHPPVTVPVQATPAPARIGPSAHPGQPKTPSPSPSTPPMSPPAPAAQPPVAPKTRPAALPNVPKAAPPPKPALPKATPPDATAAPHPAAAETHRPGRPDCGHPGQAPCRP